MKRGTIINNRIIKKEPQTQKLTERTNTDTLQDLPIPLRGGGERHPAAAQTRHTEVTALRDLHNLSKGEVKFHSEQRELRNLGGGQTNPHLHTVWLLKESNHPHQTQNRHPGGFSEGRRVCAANPARMIKQPNEAKFCEGKMKRSALAVSARIIRYNLFQGLANVAEGDELHTKTAVKCDKARFRNKFGMTSKKSGNLECHIA